MRCWIYRGSKRDGLYLYLAEAERFDQVPEAVLQAMGRLELAMELELRPGRRLARADVARVLHELESRGFYLQLPPGSGES